VVNSSLGLRNPADLSSYREAAVDQAVWSTALTSGTVSPTVNFTVSSNLNCDNLIAVPFLTTASRVGRPLREDTYIGNETINRDKFSHIAIIGNNALSFEESFNSGVRDFNDVLLTLKSMVVA
jgi:hypothetical protein